ncbi:MAG: hypothetical protein U0K37_06335 [Acutalibacteraceae bacterium]|nr:hypothetical protein [Acutalibacteraceae bacterium]
MCGWVFGRGFEYHHLHQKRIGAAGYAGGLVSYGTSCCWPELLLARAAADPSCCWSELLLARAAAADPSCCWPELLLA